MADAELSQVIEQAEYLQKPDNYENHYNSVQDALDLALHRDEAVHKPQQQTNYGQGDNKSDEGHLVLSNQFHKAFLLHRHCSKSMKEFLS
jgi:hypothetical protein